jgi:hypothetical protein
MTAKQERIDPDVQNWLVSYMRRNKFKRITFEFRRSSDFRESLYLATEPADDDNMVEV